MIGPLSFESMQHILLSEEYTRSKASLAESMIQSDAFSCMKSKIMDARLLIPAMVVLRQNHWTAYRTIRTVIAIIS